MAIRRLMPASIPHLVVIGFLLVALPLMAALGYALFKVDGLARQSRDAVFGAVQAIQAGRTIAEQAIAMERSARQYQVLGDEVLYQRYLAQHQEFVTALADLSGYAWSGARAESLPQLQASEVLLFDTLAQLHDQKRLPDDSVLARFEDLQAGARSLLMNSLKIASHEADQLRRTSAEAQQNVLWLVAALIPLTVLVAAFFMRTITRPLREIDSGIRALGNVQFGAPIRVRGPADLRELGERLEWLRNRLVELEQQKLNFLRQVSHDLKTPLAALREGAELLHDRVLGGLSQDQAEVVQILKANSVVLQRQIEDLLRFKLPRPDAPQAMEIVPAKELAELVIAAHVLAMRAKSVKVDARLDDVCTLGAREQIRIIFDNLLSNAVKYSPENGSIRIRLWNGGEQICFEIQDQGPGIAPDERDKVFEAFYQGAPARPGRIKGTGLGLAIVKEYTRLNQGSVEIVPSAAGAYLRVKLPCCPCPKRIG